MGKIGHLSQIWLYSEESAYRRVIEELMNVRPEMRRVLADEAVLQQVKEFEESQLQEFVGFEENTTENMERMALIDPLTGAYNGRSFLKELDQTLKQAWRYSRNASLCMVSIDGFDDIVSSFGSLTGNTVLRICASAVQKTVRPADSLARYSGTDFGVIMPNTTTSQAVMIGERIREALATQIITHNWNHIRITASIGIATYPLHAYDRDELISIAMQALYVSKERGGDRVCTI